MGKKWRTESEKYEFFLSKSVDKAVREHNMIEQGDRVLVGVSGGKDSMALLRLLIYRQKHAPVNFELMAAHIKGDATGPGVTLPDSFIEWLKAQGVEFHIRDIILPQDEPLPMNCERCGRNRRRTLFEIAEEMGCNKVALGHHLEDFSHTALMNLFQHGRLETMAFRRDYFKGRFSVIRPLAYIRESDVVRFVKAGQFPVVPAACPLAGKTSRQSATDVMQVVTKHFRQAHGNIIRAACNEGLDMD